MEHISDFLSTTMAAVLPSRPSPPTRGTPTPSSQNWTRSHTLGSVQLQLSSIWEEGDTESGCSLARLARY